MELSMFRPQGTNVQHGGIQGALRVRVLEAVADGFRCAAERKDRYGIVRQNNVGQGPAAGQGDDIADTQSDGVE